MWSVHDVRKMCICGCPSLLLSSASIRPLQRCVVCGVWWKQGGWCVVCGMYFLSRKVMCGVWDVMWYA